MSPSASSSHRCPECGKPLPPASADQTRPVCPACLLAQALASGTAFEPALDLAVSPSASATAQPPPTPEEIADKFPQFEILASLGRGGMGVVYKARQKSLKRLVAIKILAPGREHDARFAERFAREAELLAKLSHPHIVTIHDFGETAGLFYIVMEFVDGVNLRDLIREGRLAPAQALAIVPPICEALQYAHDHGIVHRDIKPENLLLDREGRVKIADFGIAALVGSGDGARERAGTPPYMAPEQNGAKPAADHRADIYALGVVLYEMLTGERPAKDVVAPSRKVQIDVRLDEIVLRALEKSPDLRYQTAGEFRTSVETVTAPPIPPAASVPAPDATVSSRPAEAPHLSLTAIMGALLALSSFIGWPMLDGLRHAIPGASGPEITVPPLLRILLTDIIPVCLVFGHVSATALGWIAVRQIRGSAGRLRGLGLAMFDGLFFPLIILNGLVCIGALRVIQATATILPFWLRLLCGMAGLMLLTAVVFTNILLVRRVWLTVRSAPTQPDAAADVRSKRLRRRFGIPVLTAGVIAVGVMLVSHFIPLLRQERKTRLVSERQAELAAKFGPVIPFQRPEHPEFGPTVELVVPVHPNGYSDTLDLDSGALVPTPKMANPWEWRSTLLPYGVIVIPATDAHPTMLAGTSTLVWPLPAGVEEYWTGSMALPNATAPSTISLNLGETRMANSTGSPPHVFAFQTPRGKRGLLQVTGFIKNPRGLKLCYKLVQNQPLAAPSPEFADHAIRLGDAAPGAQPAPEPEAALRRERIIVEDLALLMIVAIREKDDAKLRSLASDRIKGWPEALPQFAVEMREHYRRSTGDEALDLRASDSLVEGELAAVKCTGPKKLQGKCLVLFFVKTADGWRNYSLQASMETVPLAKSLERFRKTIEKKAEAAPTPDSPAHAPAAHGPEIGDP